MRKKVIAGNWKMNKTIKEVNHFIDTVKNYFNEQASIPEAIICAPFPYLHHLVEQTQNTNLSIAAQNMHYEANGAYTGEVSPVMLRDLGVRYVIIGHSERRQYFNETDESVNKKVHAAFAHQLIPIICVGETLEQKEQNQTNEHIKHQVEYALQGLSADQMAQTIIAYEPIWAIGTGQTATSEAANEVCTFIREVVKDLSSEKTAEKLIIQYGGSVKPENISELLSESNIDGALVGGASLEATSFLKLVEAGNEHE